MNVTATEAQQTGLQMHLDTLPQDVPVPSFDFAAVDHASATSLFDDLTNWEELDSFVRAIFLSLLSSPFLSFSCYHCSTRSRSG